jgi:hypothetical protein
MQHDIGQEAEAMPTSPPSYDGATPDRGSASWTGYGDDFTYGDTDGFDDEDDGGTQEGTHHEEGDEDGDDDASSTSSTKDRWASLYNDKPGHGVWHEASAKGCRVYWTTTYREGNPLGWHCSACSRGIEATASSTTLEGARNAAIGALLRDIEGEKVRISARRMAKASRTLEKKMSEAVESRKAVCVNVDRRAEPKGGGVEEDGGRAEDDSPDQEEFVVIY